MKTWNQEKISVIALVLLITGAIDSIRNLPTTALFGSSLVFFFIFSAIVFLIPVALVSAELSSTWSEEEGGVYSWVRLALGNDWAFVTIWLQWINTLVWYPTILAFIAGTLAYLIQPELAQNKYYLVWVIFILFWLLTFLGLFGLRASAAFASFCAIFGMILPMGFIIFSAFLWMVQGHSLAIDLSISNLLPDWKNTSSWISLTAIMTSFLGMELAAVHVRNIENPQRNFPRAMYFSVILILITMILGSLAIAFILPKEKIGLVNGVMQAFTHFFQDLHLTPLLPVMGVLLLLGSLGSMINWVISPAKGLLLAANHGFFPAWFYSLNRYGVASRILITQGIIVTFLCGVFLLFPTINAIYWLFTALSTELYIIMYVMMFIAAVHLKRKFAHLPRPFQIPGGKYGYYFTCFLGLIGCSITLIVGFFPPENSMDVGGASYYRVIFLTGILIMGAPAAFFCLRRRVKEREKQKE